MRVCLRTSECYLTVAGDRRAVHALKKYQESVLRVELRMTAVTVRLRVGVRLRLRLRVRVRLTR